MEAIKQQKCFRYVDVQVGEGGYIFNYFIKVS